MFHIERNKNSSIICYDLEMNEKTIDKKKPVNAYWEMPEQNHSRNELSKLQYKLAYGLTIEEIENNTINFNLKAYPLRQVKVIYNPENNEVKAFTFINGILAILNKLYIYASPPFYNSVEYIILTGCDPETGETVTERINNE